MFQFLAVGVPCRGTRSGSLSERSLRTENLLRNSQSLLAYIGRAFLPQIAEQEGPQSRDSQRRFPWLSGPVSGRQAGRSQGQVWQFLNKIRGYTHGSTAAETKSTVFSD